MMTNGWQTVPLGEVLTERKETPSPESLENGEVSIVSKIGFNEGKIELRADGKTRTGMILARPGDLVVSGINATKGAIAVYPETARKPIAATIHYGAYIPNKERVSVQYLWWFLRSEAFRDIVRHHIPDGIKTELKSKRFLAVPMPLPPLKEQQRILAHIESLAARVNEAQRLREEADYESSVLHGSFAAKALNEVSNAPKHNIGDICEVRGGIQKSPARLPHLNPVPYLTVAHVQRNHIDVSSETRYFEVLPEELPRWKLEIGDLLNIEGNGSADQIGRVALYRGELGTCVHQNHVIRARPHQEIILSEYLNMYLNSPLGQDEVQKRSRTTSGLRTLSVGRIREIEIPIPPLDEQRRIVAYLDGLQAKVNALRELQSASGKELSALMPSILDKAFKGEL
ncbi:MAG: restriction endonuclease subunit S [Anaerolineae bacterium]|nr:restriction endonuclease subunit S [Anaerolineae bacterium]